MERLSQLSCKVIIFTCLLYCCVDGFSVGRSKLGKSIEKKYGENGFDVLKTLENINSGYQFISKFLKNSRDGDQGTARATINQSGFGTSGVAGCDDCFMGLRVSRREASVVSLESTIFALTNRILLYIEISLTIISLNFNSFTFRS